MNGKKIFVTLVQSFMALFVGIAAGGAFAADASDDTVIVGATLIDSTGSEPLEDSLIYVRAGKIARIDSGRKAALPDAAEVIDATGKFIIPGIVDAHTHIDSVGGIPLDEEQKRLVREYYPKAFLFHGVTTVINMSAHDVDWVFQLRDRVRTNPESLLPRIYTGASHFTSEGGWGGRHGGGVQSLADIDRRLDEYGHMQVDLVKIINEDGLGGAEVFPAIPPEFIQRVTEKCRQMGIPVFIHATDETEYLQSLRARPRAMAHGLFTPQSETSPLVAELRNNDIFVIPTAVLFEAFYFFRDDPALLENELVKKSVPDFILTAMSDSAVVDAAFRKMDEILKMDSSSWARSAVPALLDNVRLFAENGVKIAIGTDGGGAVVHSFQGFNTPREMELLAECCLGNMGAIIAATRTPAEIMQATGVFGVLAPGRSADLLILNSNPVSDIRAVRDFDHLMLRGRLVARSALTYSAHVQGAAGNPVGSGE
jgi:imidazolonepropionase-like amidohydrolase